MFTEACKVNDKASKTTKSQVPFASCVYQHFGVHRLHFFITRARQERGATWKAAFSLPFLTVTTIPLQRNKKPCPGNYFLPDFVCERCVHGWIHLNTYLLRPSERETCFGDARSAHNICSARGLEWFEQGLYLFVRLLALFCTPLDDDQRRALAG